MEPASKAMTDRERLKKLMVLLDGDYPPSASRMVNLMSDKSVAELLAKKEARLAVHNAIKRVTDMNAASEQLTGNDMAWDSSPAKGSCGGGRRILLKPGFMGG